MTDNWRIHFWRAQNLREQDPELALEEFRIARKLATQAGDPRALLEIDHWTLQAMIYRARDFTAALPLAVQATIEARKPQFQDMMERICVHDDMIGTYLGIDPLGYDAMIEQAMDYMERETPPGIQCAYCLQSYRASFALHCGRYEEAAQRISEYLAMSEHFQHHFLAAQVMLCQYTYRQGQWEAMLKIAQQLESDLLDDDGYLQDLCLVLAAQALGQRKQGDEAAATLAYRRAVTKAASTRVVMEPMYFDLLADYHEASGGLEEAANLRQRQLEQMAGKGQHYWEARARLHRLSLLKRLGQPIEAEIEPTRQVIQRLQQPAELLTALEKLSGS